MPLLPVLAAAVALSAGLSDAPLPSKPPSASTTTPRGFEAPPPLPPEPAEEASPPPPAPPPNVTRGPDAGALRPPERTETEAAGSEGGEPRSAPGSGVLRHVLPHFRSIQGGETLDAGGTVLAFSGGFSTLSATFAQGLRDDLDYGLQLEFDWGTTEVFAGPTFRKLVARSDPFLLAFRARGGFYGSLGSTWLARVNGADGGVQLQPGLGVSARTCASLFSLALDVPVDVTFSRGGGFAMGFRGVLAFETPLRPDLVIGLRAGLGLLGSSGGAPFAPDSPKTLYDASVLMTYQFL